jgi:hypothetical protein
VPRVHAAVVRPRGFQIALLGGSERRGAWTPPRELYTIAVMGGAGLDFREAVMPPGVTEAWDRPARRLRCARPGACRVRQRGTPSGDQGSRLHGRRRSEGHASRRDDPGRPAPDPRAPAPPAPSAQ